MDAFRFAKMAANEKEHAVLKRKPHALQKHTSLANQTHGIWNFDSCNRLRADQLP
jgi:hypothetical protein